MNNLPDLYPLRLTRRLESRLWGGQQLADWLGVHDAPPQLAESWEIYVDNTIHNGAYAGQTLRQLVAQHGPAIVGTRSFQRYGYDFPLLAKFIDAGQALSVQVHPDDTYAHQYEAATGFHGKTEAWHIIATQGDCDIIHGFNHPLSRTAYAKAIADGTLEALLHRTPVSAGDTVYVPAGTVHAINAGIVLFEIQQTSDLTYRVYDYQRRDAHGNLRELHIPQAIAVSHLDVSPTVVVPPTPVAPGVTELVRSDYFVMERITGSHTVTWAHPADSPHLITVLAGTLTITHAGHAETLTRGQSIVIPAALSHLHITPQPEATWLHCWVPEESAS
jgi:mannose-6-phosphate isomerase